MKLNIFFCFILFLGCQSVPSSQVMINPDTGEGKMVSHHSWGYGLKGMAAAIGAQQAQKSDIAALKKAGFVEIDKIGGTGIYFDKKFPDKPAIIIKVHPNGPAAQAGIKPGDLLVERNNQPIKNIGDLQSQPRPQIGQIMQYKIIRDGKTIAFTVVAVQLSQYIENH